MIFPEGVVTNGQALVQFKVGAFSSGQPVTPVCLRYPFKHYNPCGCGKNTNVGMAILRMLLQFKNRCEIDVLDTYVPSELEKEDPRIFAGNVRMEMAAHLQVPFTEHSYDDAFLVHASKAHVGNDFEISQLKSMYNYTFDDLKALLKTFEQCDRSNSGVISYTEFKQAMSSGGLVQEGSDVSVERLKSVERVFAFIDQDHSGGIEYREFVQIAALLSGRCSLVSRAQLAFLVYDVEGKGKVQRRLLRQAVDDSVAHPRTSSVVSDTVDSADELSPGSQLLGNCGDEEDTEELDMDEFCKLVESQPAVLEDALDLVRDRLGMSGNLGHLIPGKKDS